MTVSAPKCHQLAALSVQGDLILKYFRYMLPNLIAHPLTSPMPLVPKQDVL